MRCGTSCATRPRSRRCRSRCHAFTAREASLKDDGVGLHGRKGKENRDTPSLFLAALLLLGPASNPAAAAIFTVQPGTTFYSEPKKSEQFQLSLPEVRVVVPPMQDARGFCRFKLVYKIADRDNPDLPKSAWARCVVTDRFISK